MINKLTGLPLSSEAIDILKRLNRDETVSLEEIQNLREIKEAYSCLSTATHTIKLKDRENIQKGVFFKLQEMGSAVIDEKGNTLYNGIIRKESRIDIVIGLPASGKSSTLVNPISKKYKSRIIDSDEAKKLLPEFNNGWGAGTVHEESKLIAQNQLITALQCKENIVWPIVGSKIDKLERQLSVIKQSYHYRIYLHFNEIPKNKAIGRMLLRFFEEGRFLDPRLCYQYANVSDVYESLKKRGDLVNGYTKWNNDVKKGERPRFVEATAGSLSGSFHDNRRDGRTLRGSTDKGSGTISRESGEIYGGNVEQKLKDVNKPSILQKIENYKNLIKNKAKPIKNKGKIKKREKEMDI